ncbi:HD domain-containing protein [Brachybacterium subflavum]|uniref:HD domain-containing protein n=1 Tax=Brachybacterium subflavum TaxID=2585206 RepID=UPI0012661D5C|nr:HD domain-containing protein [Brachybacterium subflavum]
MRGIDADTLGLDGRWFDPVWRIEIELMPLELELLDAWWVRRLAFIAHAGIASFTTTQSYTRIEHSLGVLALTAHFAPDDRAARATALLHDIGHLPFSHTLEGIAGLDHHRIGRERITELDPMLRRHGLDAAEVIAIDEGTHPSPLTNASGALKLDHLDSFLRSGQAHGRTRTPPREMLERLRLVDGAVDTDEATAHELADLIAAEARHQRAPSNIVPIAVLKHLVTTALENGSGFDAEHLALLTDGELWAALLADPATRELTLELRAHPQRWHLVPSAARGIPAGAATADGASADSTSADGTSADGAPEALDVHIRRGYLALPTVDGSAFTDPQITALEDALPLHLRVVRA